MLSAMHKPLLFACALISTPALGSGEALPPGARDLHPPALDGSISPAWMLGATPPRLTWLEPTADGGTAVRMATLGKGGWQEPGTIISGTKLFTNWADFPSAAVAPDGTYYAHWLEKSAADPYAYGIELAQSTDQGKSWQRLGRLHEDATPAEHGFVSFAPDGARLRAFWLDGRATPGGGAMALRTALLGPAIGPSTELDARVCDCCQTTAVSTGRGAAVFFRDRSPEEVRDISAVRREGAGWTTPSPVANDGWKVPGCPVNGPRADARGEALAVAWFSGAEAGGGQRVQVAFSEDAGSRFSAPIILDRAAPLGRVDLALTPDGSAVVSWLASAGERGAVTLRRVRRDGKMGEPLVVAHTSKGRASGFPRLLLDGGELLIAWVELAEERSAATVRVAALPLDRIPAP